MLTASALSGWLLPLLLLVMLAPALTPAFAQESPTPMTTVHPKTHDRHLRNPGMGFIFYSGVGLEQVPEEADIIFACVPVWAQVEKIKGQYDWDIPQIKGVIDLAHRTHRRWGLRIMPSFQGHKHPIPTWLVNEGVRIFAPDPKWLATQGQQDLNEPEWWNPTYITAFERFVQAYGRRFDGEQDLEFIDMRYYGFWGEGHRFGATEPWPAAVSKRHLLQHFIDMHLAAFTRTPLVVETARDQNEPYPEGTAIDYALAKGCWMRRDGFGGYMHDTETRLIQQNWQQHPLVAENGFSYADALAGKIPGHTLESVFDEMLAHHVSYFPLGWGIKDWEAVQAQRPDLIKKASLRMGYRLIITEANWPTTLTSARPATITTTWRNTGVAGVPYPYTPALYLLDPATGKQIARATNTTTDLRKWYDGADQKVVFHLDIPSAPAGRYDLAIAIEDTTGAPALELAIQGPSANKRFVLGQVEIAAPNAPATP